jgi:hypothetical protein
MGAFSALPAEALAAILFYLEPADLVQTPPHSSL